ncbi:MAG: 50S ribosomal protein L14e [Promethearchaeota archaeon]
MPILEIGRICVKTLGREAGKKCVIVEIIDKKFALVTGPKDVSDVKRRRVNINHIELTPDKIDIKKGASDEEVKKVIEDSGKLDYMKAPIEVQLT